MDLSKLIGESPDAWVSPLQATLLLMGLFVVIGVSLSKRRGRGGESGGGGDSHTRDDGADGGGEGGGGGDGGGGE